MDDLPIHFSFVEGIAVITADGPCTMEVIGLVGAAVEKLVARGYWQIVLDLRSFEQISSAALGILMAYIEEGMENGAELALVVEHYRVENVLDLLGLRRLLALHRSVSDAIDGFLFGGDEGYTPET